jgi:hypothetical protein
LIKEFDKQGEIEEKTQESLKSDYGDIEEIMQNMFDQIENED